MPRTLLPTLALLASSAYADRRTLASHPLYEVIGGDDRLAVLGRSTNDLSDPSRRTLLHLCGIDVSGLNTNPRTLSFDDGWNVLGIAADPNIGSETMEFDEIVNIVRDSVDDNLHPDGSLVIVGESFGATVALCLADDMGSRVDHCICINPATSFTSTDWFHRDLEEVGCILKEHGPSPIEKFHLVADVILHPGRARSLVSDYSKMRENMTVPEARSVLARRRKWLIDGERRATSSIQNLRCPVTLVAGVGDSLLPSAREVNRLNQLAQNGRVLHVPGSHFLSNRRLKLREIVDFD